MNTPVTAPTEFDAFFLATTAHLVLDTPDGEPMLFNGQPVAVNLYSPATPEFVAAQTKREREVTQRVVSAMADKNKNKSKKTDATDDADADAKFLCAVTAGFENFPFPGGAEAIYREPRLKYINNQVNRHLSDLGNFFGAPKTS